MCHMLDCQRFWDQNRGLSTKSDGSLHIIGAANCSHVKVSSRIHAGRSPCIPLHPVKPDVATAVLQGTCSMKSSGQHCSSAFAGSHNRITLR